MPQDKGKTNLNIKLRAELNVPETENPIRFELSTVGGEHSLFQGKITSEEPINIKNLVNAFDSGLGESIPDDIAITFEKLLLVLNKEQSTTTSNKQPLTTTLLIALELGTEINLSNLPLVGKQFSPEQTLAVSIQV